ncbi:MAG: hypothetical protein IPP48_16175 [Chitinophagaceae bacterium]|nr:hypothetical protein [Chitinophagaceae bacterium]
MKKISLFIAFAILVTTGFAQKEEDSEEKKGGFKKENLLQAEVQLYLFQWKYSVRC